MKNSVKQPFYHSANQSKRKQYNGSAKLPASSLVAKGIKTFSEAYKLCKNKNYAVHGVTGDLMVVKYTSGAPTYFS